MFLMKQPFYIAAQSSHVKIQNVPDGTRRARTVLIPTEHLSPLIYNVLEAYCFFGPKALSIKKNNFSINDRILLVIFF